jgi:hypothetical protein
MHSLFRLFCSYPWLNAFVVSLFCSYPWLTAFVVSLVLLYPWLNAFVVSLFLLLSLAKCIRCFACFALSLAECIRYFACFALSLAQCIRCFAQVQERSGDEEARGVVRSAGEGATVCARGQSAHRPARSHSRCAQRLACSHQQDLPSTA